MSNVIEFPTAITSDVTEEQVEEFPKTCDGCVHYMSGYLGQFCRAYNEDIFNVHEAEDCDLHESI